MYTPLAKSASVGPVCRGAGTGAATAGGGGSEEVGVVARRGAGGITGRGAGGGVEGTGGGGVFLNRPFGSRCCFLAFSCLHCLVVSFSSMPTKEDALRLGTDRVAGMTSAELRPGRAVEEEFKLKIVDRLRKFLSFSLNF